MAFEDDFTSYVIDYGSFPDQKRLYFTLNQAKNTLQNLKPKSGYDGQIWYGFEQLTELLTTEGRYKDENNVARHIDRIFIDANYGNSTKTVYKFCKESPHARILTPAHGRFVSVRQKPYSQYRKVRGEFLGHHWHMPLPDAGKVRHINNDINYWKSFVFNCLTVQQGDPGAMTLWGDSPGLHKMFAEQMRSECCLRVMGNDRVIDEWKLLPYRPDNHFLDCVVGCYCGASLLGVQVNTGPKLPVKKVEKSFKKKEKVSYIQI
jgi:hypothetical protein